MSWQFWIDRGGTFTDVVAKNNQMSGAKSLTTLKVLSDQPQRYADAAVYAIQQIIGKSDIKNEDIDSIKMGTTVATNALLEKKGARVALLTNSGFADLLRIGDQTRSDLFALNITQTQMVYEQVFEINVRQDAQGEIIKSATDQQIKAVLQQILQSGLKVLVVSLVHGYLNDALEYRIYQLALSMQFEWVVYSGNCIQLIKWVNRTSTMVVDAYLSPILRLYVNKFTKHLGCSPKLQFMQSNGGLTDEDQFFGKDAVLSGPAGGVIGFVHAGTQLAKHQLIGFDMGGTSTDVSHYAGELERSQQSVIAGIQLTVPMLNIHTVAAGGGSICEFINGKLTVGPHSAGANPGPACYGLLGPLTVTDCNVILGRITEDALQRDDHGLLLNRQASVKQAQCILQQLPRHFNINTVEQLAVGFLNIAVDAMAVAIKKISTQQGYDLTQYSLVSFGGAGGQHACQVASELHIKHIILHPFAGVLSAYGMGLADQRLLKQQTLQCELTDVSKIEQSFKELHQKGQMQWQHPDKTSKIRRQIAVTGQDTDSQIVITMANLQNMQQQFCFEYRRLYGFDYPHNIDSSLWVEYIQLEWVKPSDYSQLDIDEKINEIDFDQFHLLPTSPCTCPVYLDQNWQDIALYDRSSLTAFGYINGPAYIKEADSTLYLAQNWQLYVLNSGSLLLRDCSKKVNLPAPIDCCSPLIFDPVKLEIFNHRFTLIAEQMGAVLEKTARSVNMKERLDFSCALFTNQGDLIANAPHIPVHLGSMSDSINYVIKHCAKLMPGDVLMMNSPYIGGTHLPDITVVKGVFLSHSSKADFYVAARGHHADVGGLTPGSMPAFSQHIEQEGILIEPTLICTNGEFLQEVAQRIFASARNSQQNLADLQAQIAACEVAGFEFQRTKEQYSLEALHFYSQALLTYSNDCLLQVLPRIRLGSASIDMDDGTQIQVRLRLHKSRLSVDFTGSSPTHKGNFNAPTSVVKAAVLYVLRCVCEHSLPLNDGFLHSVDIYVDPDSLLAPTYPAAVVSGNVETAQYLVDVLLMAMQQLAGSQGTNNNLTFGNDVYQYYETLCGGAGAGNGFSGADAVHVHMTNSRLTDIEILESRYPVRLKQFSLRSGSAGRGAFNGGEGVTRKIEFLQPMSMSIISSHRRIPAKGIAGGQDAQPGLNRLLLHTGEVLELEGCDSRELSTGDVIEINTPGGAGFGLE